MLRRIPLIVVIILCGCGSQPYDPVTSPPSVVIENSPVVHGGQTHTHVSVPIKPALDKLDTIQEKLQWLQEKLDDTPEKAGP